MSDVTRILSAIEHGDRAAEAMQRILTLDEALTRLGVEEPRWGEWRSNWRCRLLTVAIQRCRTG